MSQPLATTWPKQSAKRVPSGTSASSTGGILGGGIGVLGLDPSAGRWAALASKRTFSTGQSDPKKTGSFGVIAKIRPSDRFREIERAWLDRSVAHKVPGILPTTLGNLSDSSAEEEDLAERFGELRDVWKSQHQLTSSTTAMSMAVEYQEIIGLGPDVIPILLAELRDNPDRWFWALSALTGENPVSQEDRGNFEAMRTAWLEWGRRNDMLDPPQDD